MNHFINFMTDTSVQVQSTSACCESAGSHILTSFKHQNADDHRSLFMDCSRNLTHNTNSLNDSPPHSSVWTLLTSEALPARPGSLWGAECPECREEDHLIESWKVEECKDFQKQESAESWNPTMEAQDESVFVIHFSFFLCFSCRLRGKRLSPLWSDWEASWEKSAFWNRSRSQRRSWFPWMHSSQFSQALKNVAG